MLFDDFEHQGVDPIAVTNQSEQEPVGVIQFGAIELTVANVGQLLDIGRPEIIAGNSSNDLVVLGAVLRGVQASVFENSHAKRVLGRANR